jgi:hypothetical protein
MTIRRRHNSAFQAFSCFLAFLMVYGLVFKPIHLLGDLQEASLHAAAFRVRETKLGVPAASGASSGVRAALPAEPPCAICAALSQMNVSAAVTSYCPAFKPVFTPLRLTTPGFYFCRPFSLLSCSSRAPPFSVTDSLL